MSKSIPSYSRKLKGGNEKIFCLKCQQKSDTKGLHEEVKNKRRFAVGTCDDCGTKKYKILGMAGNKGGYMVQQPQIPNGLFKPRLMPVQPTIFKKQPVIV